MRVKEGPVIMSDIPQKRCSHCLQWFPATPEFFCRRLEGTKDGLYSQCRTCQNKARTASALRMKAKLNGHSHTRAIVVPLGTSEQCGCCGNTRGNILGDIDKVTREKYGYLCARCYQLVRDFQGDPEKIRKVLDYVERTRTNRTMSIPVGT